MAREEDCFYEFHPFRLNVRERLLLKDGQPINIENIPFDLLCTFLQQPNRLLTREALRQAVWKDTHVDSNTLNVTISILRKLLGDSPSEHRFIQTVPKGGYRFVAPVWLVSLDAPLATAMAHEHRANSLWRFRRGAVVLVFSLALLIGTARLLPHKAPVSNPARPLTVYLGHETSPAVSPDGTQIAFSWEQPGEDRDIYVLKLSDPGTPLRLTRTADNDESPAWSPDGRRIAFVRNRGDDGAIYVTDSSGGPEQKLITTKGLSVAWTRSPSRLVYDDIVPGAAVNGLFTVSADTGSRQQLTSPIAEAGHGDFWPSVSPDGQTVAFSRRLTYNNADIYMVPMDGGVARQVTLDRRPIGGVAWTPDGEQLIFSSARTGRHRLWRVAPVVGAQPRLVDGITEDVLHPSLPSSASLPPWPLAYERAESDYNIWMIDRASTQVAPYPASGLISSTRLDQAPRISPDGKRIAFISDRSDSFELWVCDFPRGHNCARLTSFRGAYVGSPTWSPDSRTVACDARVNGNADIYAINTNGSHLKRLTSEMSVESRPNWSRDGQWVYHRSDRTGRHEIWKTPAAGGDAVQVTHDGGFEAFESIDGSQLYFIRSRSSPGLWMRQLDSGRETLIRELREITASAWAPARSGIYWLDPTTFSSQYINSLRLFDAKARSVSPVGEVRAWVIPTATGFTVSEDERYLMWSQLDRDVQDLMLVAEFR